MLKKSNTLLHSPLTKPATRPIHQKLFLFTLAIFFSAPALAGELTLPKFNAADKVLVVAYHPQDEVLGAFGLMQEAKKSGAQVKVLYLTHGEANEISTILYQKRPLLLKNDFLKSGQMHRSESIQAMALLNINEKDLVFLGYPDGGLSQMWLKYWGTNKNYKSLLTRIDKVPYENSATYAHPYQPEFLVADIEKVISDYQPTIIVLPSASDLSAERQATNLFAKLAIYNLNNLTTKNVQVYGYFIRANKWPKPKKYSPGDGLDIPPYLQSDQKLKWFRLPISDAQGQLKKTAIEKMKSRFTFRKKTSLAFVRKNELFLLDEDFRLNEVDVVLYETSKDFLMVHIPRVHSIDEAGVMTFYIFGYKKDVPFSKMPKVSLKFFGNKLNVFDGSNELSESAVEYHFEQNKLYLKLPMSLLNNPKLLFVSIRNSKEQPSIDFGAWRVLKV